MKTSISLRKALILTASGAALCFSNAAIAQTATDQDDTSIQDTVVITGTRGAPAQQRHGTAASRTGRVALRNEKVREA